MNEHHSSERFLGSRTIPKPTDLRDLTLPDGFGVADWPEEDPAPRDVVADRQVQRAAWERGEIAYHIWIDPNTREEVTGNFLPFGQELTAEEIEDRTRTIGLEWGSEVQFIGPVEYKPPTA